MITPKMAPRLTKSQQQAADADAYEIATNRDLNTCQRCRRDCGPIARDHRQNRMPGNTVPSNLQCLGLRCHQWKTEHPAQALDDGWAVPRYAVPAEWPARRWVSTGFTTLRLGWVLYTDDGQWSEISDDEAQARIEGRWTDVI